MNQELFDACEFAKIAADMTIPLDAKGAQSAVSPEPGSQVNAGMENVSTFNPASVGAQTYAGALKAKALEEAREAAACAAQKTASVMAYEDGFSAGYDFAMEKVALEVADVQQKAAEMLAGAKGKAAAGVEAAKAFGAKGIQAVKNNPKAAAGAAAALAAMAGGGAYAARQYNSPKAKAMRMLKSRAGKAGLAAAGLAALAGGTYAATREKKASIEEAYEAGYNYAMEKVALEVADVQQKAAEMLAGAKGKIGAGYDAAKAFGAKGVQAVKNNPKAAAGAAAALAAMAGGGAYAARQYNSPKAKAMRMLKSRAGKAGLAAAGLAALAGGTYATTRD